MTNQEILDAWYRYAGRTTGFIGAALRTQRSRTFMTEEQQRALIGIQDGQYDQFWLRLQAMLLPREETFATDLEQIIAKVVSNVERATLNLEHLGELIRAGSE